MLCITANYGWAVYSQIYFVFPNKHTEHGLG